jgi:hypothetical protein
MSYVPEAVAAEIRAGHDEPAARAIDASTWLKVVSVDAVPPEIAAWNLGPGESAVHRVGGLILPDPPSRFCLSAHSEGGRICI